MDIHSFSVQRLYSHNSDYNFARLSLTIIGHKKTTKKII